jgi:hypothetical protein
MKIETRVCAALLSAVAVFVAGCSDDETLEGTESDACAADSCADAFGTDGGADVSSDTDVVEGDAADVSLPDPVELTIAEGCNPLAFEEDCFFPFPSDFFLQEGGDLPSGHTVAITGAAQVFNTEGSLIDMTAVYPSDGFSHHPIINAYFTDEPDNDQFLGWLEDPAPSTEPDYVTLLLDTETSEFVPHFSELDARPGARDRHALYIRPLVRLENERRYVVAIQGIVNGAGETITAPSGFVQLRDGVPTTADSLEALRERYESEVFGPLETMGVDRGNLTLAWDFTTQSLENVTTDMLRSRELALDAFALNNPSVQVDEVLEGSGEGGLGDLSDLVARQINGTIEVPLVVDSDRPGAVLLRDNDGVVRTAGTARARFSLMIPHSVLDLDDPQPTRVVQFGHGFFGGLEEAMGSVQAEAASEGGWIVAAVDWWGMSSPDLGPVAEMISSDPTHTFDFTDRLHQGMVNFMALSRAIQTTMQDVPELQEDGVSLLSDSELYFYGISQGHILGGTFFALSPDIDRAVMSVGGASFTLMMSRAAPFGQFLAILSFGIADELDVQKFIAMSPFAMDRIDPMTYVPLTFDSPIDPASDKRILMNVGIGDSTVPNVANYLHARALGLPALVPTGEVPPLMESLDLSGGGQDTSALLMVDYNIVPRPDIESRLSGPANCVHGSVRTQPFVIEQMSAFMRPDGQIVFPCEGACEASCD